MTRMNAMKQLGNGLSTMLHHEDALSVREAELAMRRRLGLSELNILSAQSNLAMTYGRLGQHERAIHIERDVYSGRLKLHGKEHRATLLAANNYAWGLFHLERFKEIKALMRKMTPVARRTLGEGNATTLRMRWIYAIALRDDDGATLDDLREAVTMLEDAERIARRFLGSANPVTPGIEESLLRARAALSAELETLDA